MDGQRNNIKLTYGLEPGLKTLRPCQLGTETKAEQYVLSERLIQKVK